MRTLIIDGNNLAHRCRHAINLSYKGIDVSVLYGVIKSIKSLYAKYSPYSVVVCWDGGAPKYRYDAVPTYKKRDRSDDPSWPRFIEQLNELHEVLPDFGVVSLRGKSIEADDFMAHAAKLISGDKIIITTDKDLYQAVSHDTCVINPVQNKVINHSNLHKHTGLSYENHPDNLLTFRAMVGDTSDNIPGIYRIGEKSALKIIREYGHDPKTIIKNAIAKKSPGLKSLNKKLVDHGIENLQKTILAMDLSIDLAGARLIISVVIDIHHGADRKKAVKWLKKYFFISLFDEHLINAIKRLKCPVIAKSKPPKAAN